ncbi:MAG: peptide chain release factor-like protein [Candidatus Omnitrophica bacterium]|nr:peptide chain release factor-like protein [Candidatus Omnitrophota bacterium]
MIKFPVSEKKIFELEAVMLKLGLFEKDISESFTRSPGPGGQHVNKTSTTVFLKHGPSGLEVKCSMTRSQAMNRFFARRMLVSKIEQIRFSNMSPEEQERNKIRKQKRKRHKRAKAKTVRNPTASDDIIHNETAN